MTIRKPLPDGTTLMIYGWNRPKDENWPLSVMPVKVVTQ